MGKIPPKLRREWADKLAQSGFVDIEDTHGNLNKIHTRAAAWEMGEETLAYFSLLSSYLEDNKQLSRLERKILEMHSEGVHRPDIAHEVYRSLGYIKLILARHRKRFLNKE